MSPPAIAEKMRQEAPQSNWLERKPIQNAREVVSRRRLHQVPSTLLAPLRAELAASVRAGRSILQSAREYQTTQFVAMELFVREEIRRVSVRLEMLEAAIGGRRAA